MHYLLYYAAVQVYIVQSTLNPICLKVIYRYQCIVIYSLFCQKNGVSPCHYESTACYLSAARRFPQSYHRFIKISSLYICCILSSTKEFQPTIELEYACMYIITCWRLFILCHLTGHEQIPTQNPFVVLNMDTHK